jgi:tetratricopeptide (TPR) repeat protein
MRRMVLERGPEIRRWILGGSLVLIPLIVVRTLNNGVNAPKLALLIIVVGLVAAIKMLELAFGSRWVGPTNAWIPAAAFAGPLLVAWLLNAHKGWTWLGEYGRWQGLLPYLLFALWGILIADAFEGHLAPLLWAIGISGGAVGLLATLQNFGLDPIPGYTRSAVPGAVSTLGNPNFTGGFLSITLPVIAGLWSFDPSRRRWTSALFVVAITGVIVSVSQGAWVAGVVGMSLLLGLLYTDRHRWVRPGAVSIALGGVGVALILAVGPLFISPMARLSPQSIELRGMWWSAATSMGIDSPIFGHGPNAFGFKGVQYRLQEEAELDPFGFPDDPHSVLMAMFANAGLLGVAGFVIAGAWVVQRTKLTSREDVLRLALCASACAYFAQSLFSIDELSLRLVFWGVIGGLATQVSLVPRKKQTKNKRLKTKAAPRETNRSSSAVPLVRRAGLLAGAAAIGLAALIYPVRFLMADRAVAEARAELVNREVSTAVEDFERALDLRDDTEYRHLYGFRMGALGGSDSRYFENMESALAFVPDFPDLPVIRDKARVYAAAVERGFGFLPDAADLYEVALEIDPYNVLLRQEGLEVLLEAERDTYVIDYVVPLPESSKEQYAWGALAVAAARTNDEELALSALERAVTLNAQLPWVLEAQELLGIDPETP